MNKLKTLTNSALLALFLFIGAVGMAHIAHADCGSIIYPAGYYDTNSATTTTPITNCTNPFSEIDHPNSDVTYRIGTTTISEVGELLVAELPITLSFEEQLVGLSRTAVPFSTLYRQVGNDYYAVPTSDMFQLTFSATGTYALVTEVHELSLVIRPQPSSWLQSFFGLFQPATAHAQTPPPPQIYVTHFTVALPTAAPTLTGASSVLFLPGIEASRLYKSGLFGLGEDQIWPPNALFDNDVHNLAMDENGVSEEEVYTRDIIDTATGVGSVYGGFISFMDNLKTEKVIDDWAPYAYDWRYSVSDVAQKGTHYKGEDVDEIRSAIAEIERLASTSYSGKVTIIGHSNGGLLAKAVARRLESEGKTNLIDKIIFLATPQLGTPKAIGTILHGYDQSDALRGVVISQKGAREVIQNMPGAYGLLPSEKYFNGLNEPLVTFTEASATEPYRKVYGTTLSSYADVTKFLKGEDSLDRDVDNMGSIPVRANSGMVDDARSMHSNLDNWEAPSGVEVVEIVGTGLTTMKSIEYRGIVEDKCISAGQAGIICTTEAKLKPYAKLTHYGDGTVVQRSAEAYGGEKERYFVNLKKLEDLGLDTSYVHYNITEAPQVQDLLADILVSTTTEENQFISTSTVDFNDQYEVEIIDSPVRLLATDEVGNQTGTVWVDGEKVIKQEIPGSRYFEFGDTKYFVVPKGTNRTTRLYGEDYGGYTLTIAVLSGDDKQTVQTVLENATTTPLLVAEYTNTDGVFSTISTDSDGDGVVDYETTLTGEPVRELIPEYDYQDLRMAIKDLDLNQKYKKQLLVKVRLAEFFSKRTHHKKLFTKLESKVLQSLIRKLHRYYQRGIIEEGERAQIMEMISYLNQNKRKGKI